MPGASAIWNGPPAYGSLPAPEPTASPLRPFWTGTGMDTSDPFYEDPVLNSPYEDPARHWELDEAGQPTDRILEIRRRSEPKTPPRSTGAG